MPNRSVLRRIAGIAAKDIMLGNIYPNLYNMSIAGKPIDVRKVLFLETRLDDMPDSFTCVWKALEETGEYDLQFISLQRRSVTFPKFVDNCRKFVQEASTAHYIFLCDASDLVSCLPIRPATKVIQLWHACGAFKKWGMSTGDKLFGGSARDKRRHPFYENLDLVTVSSEEVVWAYREAMDLERHPEIIQPLGVSRTDVFFDNSFLSHAYDNLHTRIPEIGNRKVVLYAPTFRGTTGHATGPDWLDIEQMAKRLHDDYVLLVKHHPYVKTTPSFPSSAAGFAFNVADMPIDALLACADVCVTDYSSIVFEYSLFERPIAFFAPDIDDYDDWRGFYYDYEELTPGPVFEDTTALINWIEDIEIRFNRGMIRDFRQCFMSSCDGHATRRILDYIFNLD